MSLLERCTLLAVALATSITLAGCDRRANNAPGAGTTDATRNGPVTGTPGTPTASAPMGSASGGG